MISMPRVRHYKTLKLAIPSRPDSGRPQVSGEIAFLTRSKALDGERISLKQELEEKEESIMEANQKSSLLDKAAQLGERLVEVGGDAARLKSVASHAVEDAVTEAKRFAKRGRYAAEDLIDDAAYRVKRDPFRSVALGFAIGFSLGALVIWMATPRIARNQARED